MTKTEALLKRLDTFIEKAGKSDDLEELLEDFPEAGKLIDAIDDYETIVAKLLREEREAFIKALKEYLGDGTTSENPLVGAMVDLVTTDALESDDFDIKLSEETITFLTSTVSELTDLIMTSIDKDIAFKQLSQRTLTWIDGWGKDLGKIMKLTSHSALQEALREGIEAGASIQEIELEIKDLPEFNRARARKTAITEVLTANSVSQQEAYDQSPAVTGKTWLHSGGRSIDPRPHHVALSGTTIALDEKFSVGMEYGKYPRDTALSAKERVYCHCTLSPSVDDNILGLSKDDKEAIRARTMASLE